EQRRTLPAGAYLVKLVASGEGGSQGQELPLEVERSDTSAPRIDNLAVFPPAISPNFDGVDDVARITYRLDQRARAYAYVQTTTGEHIPLGPRALALPGEYAVQWDGTRDEAPVPDGQYQVVVQATDDAGNVSLARAPLAVQAGGQPNVRILRV